VQCHLFAHEVRLLAAVLHLHLQLLDHCQTLQHEALWILHR
jgi:hypothetical protein